MPSVTENKKPTRKIPQQAERGPQESPAVAQFKSQQHKQLQKNKKKKLAEVVDTKREVIYPTPGVTLYKEGGKHGPITAEQCKEMLGWIEYDGPEYSKEIKALLGEKVLLSNNGTNRPLYRSTIDILKQEHLRKRWRLNGEPIILGKTGLILNGQHTLISLLCAVADYKEHPENYPEWDTEPTMEKVVVTGIDENDEVVNTLDTCKPRSLTDVIYRSHYFDKLTSSDRRKCAKVCEFAIRMLWERTGIGHAFDLRRTHSESLDFLEKHPRLLECVKFVYEEDGEGEDAGKITRYIHCGFAAALMYLMAVSLSDGKAYRELEVRREDDLDFENWEKACDFWVDFASNSVKLAGIKKLYKELESVRGSLTMLERVSLFAKAWRVYAEKDSVKTLTLKYEENEDGVSVLVEHPVCGGIDLADVETASDLVHAREVPEEGEVSTDGSDSDDEEGDEKPEKAVKPTQKKQEKKFTKGMNIKIGEPIWVREESGGHWAGILKELKEGAHGKTAVVTVAKGFAGAGKSFEVHYNVVQKEQPK